MNRKITLTVIIFIFLIIFISNSKGIPTINSIYPEDGESLYSNPILMVDISNENLMNITWYFNESGQWK